jgi:chemotaxis protein CheD
VDTVTKPAKAGTPAAPADEYLITVSMADLQVCNDDAAVLAAYALGSCIGVAVWDPTSRIGGMMHVMLPSSQTGGSSGWARPAMFADTAVPLLVGRLVQLGCAKENLVVKIAGGGQLLAESKQLAIGSRNVVAVRAAFAAQQLEVTGEDVGGTKSRSLKMHVGTGRVVVCSTGEETDV